MNAAMRTVLVNAIGACLAGCVSGTVSTAFYKDPPQPSMFYVISPDSFNLTDRNISSLIEAKLSEKGYVKAATLEAANIGVFFKHFIEPSGSVVSNGRQIYTVYPRHFQIFVFDIQKSKPPEKFDFIWQGEIYSSGSSRNISDLAPIFLEQLFLNYGQTVTNKGFSH
jgi:hypothetical protein